MMALVKKSDTNLVYYLEWVTMFGCRIKWDCIVWRRMVNFYICQVHAVTSYEIFGITNPTSFHFETKLFPLNNSSFQWSSYIYSIVKLHQTLPAYICVICFIYEINTHVTGIHGYYTRHSLYDNYTAYSLAIQIC